MSYFQPRNVIRVKSKIKDKPENQPSYQEKTRCNCKFSAPYTTMNDSILIRECDNTILINWKIANIKHYEINTAKVITAYFYDGESTKTTLKGEDIFSINDALRTCIALHVGSKYYNLKGIQNLAERLSCLKCIDKMLRKLHESYEKGSKDLSDEETKDAFESIPSDITDKCYSSFEVESCINSQKTRKETCECNDESQESENSTSQNTVKSYKSCKSTTVRRHNRNRKQSRKK